MRKALQILLMPYADKLKSVAQEKEENRKYQEACDAIHHLKAKETKEREKELLKQMRAIEANDKKEKVKAAMGADAPAINSRIRFSDKEIQSFIDCVKRYMLLHDVKAYEAVLYHSLLLR